MIHVLIATRGRPSLLERTLRSLAECSLPTAFAGTIVVENGDQQGAERVVRDIASNLHAEYLFHPQANKSAALNAALARVGSGLVVFLDDDVTVSKTLLSAYAAASADTAGAAFFGGPVHPDYEARPPDWLLEYLPPSARGWQLDRADRAVKDPVFLGANWAAFVGDLRRAGGFDPRFGPGAATGSVGQEWSLMKRLLAEGLLGHYVPAAEVWHWVPRDRCSPGWALRRSYRQGIKAGLGVDQGSRSSELFGYPRWALRKAAENGGRVLVRSLRPHRSARFAAVRDFLFSIGYLKGSRLTQARGDGPAD
jgi:glycosyltransferase involved in cell wall biosynthesis